MHMENQKRSNTFVHCLYVLTEETLDMKMIRIWQAIKEYGDHLGRRTVARI
jgi:hypothetical protein